MTQAGSAEGQVKWRPVEQVGREEPDVAWPHLGLHAKIAEASHRRLHDRSVRRRLRPLTAAHEPHIEIRIASNIEMSPQLGQDLILPLVGNQPRVELGRGAVRQDRLRPGSRVSPPDAVEIERRCEEVPAQKTDGRHLVKERINLPELFERLQPKGLGKSLHRRFFRRGRRAHVVVKPVNRDRIAIDGYKRGECRD